MLSTRAGAGVGIRASGAKSTCGGPGAQSPNALSRPPPQSVKRDATVVVIDDSTTALTVVTNWLEDEGYRVVPLARALGATSTLLQVRPQILLLDIQMPGLSGDRFARILSQSPATASIPIIFHSQIDAADLKRLAHECAVVGAIAKTPARGIFIQEFNKLVMPFVNALADNESTTTRKLTDPADIGIVEIDVQRRQVKRLAGRIADMLREAQSNDERPSTRRLLRATVVELLVYMRYQLATEDRYLRQGDHAAIGEHRSRHDAFLDESKKIEHTLDFDLSLTDTMDCARRVRLLALEHLWSTDAKDFLPQ